MNIIIKLKSGKQFQNESAFRIENCDGMDLVKLHAYIDQKRLIHFKNLIIHPSEILYVCEEELYKWSEGIVDEDSDRDPS